MVAGVESWLERAFLRILRGTALPTPTMQRTYRRDGTHVARVDFDFAPLPVIVEVGGQRGYLSTTERQRQERRRNELQLLGKVIYFFTTEDVVSRSRLRDPHAVGGARFDRLVTDLATFGGHVAVELRIRRTYRRADDRQQGVA